MRFEPCHKSIKPFTNHTKMDLTKMDVNTQSVFLNHKNFLLQSAVISGDYNLVHFLLEQCKADPNTTDNYGFTPLYEASRNGYDEIIKLLIRYGAQPNQGSLTLDKNLNFIGPGFEIENMTPLHCAVKHGLLETAEVLISHGASVNVQSKQEEVVEVNCVPSTPLISAVENKAYEMVELLIKNGAEINAKTMDDYTALQYAVDNQDTRMKELLIKYGADVNMINNDDGDDENFEDDDEYDVHKLKDVLQKIQMDVE